MGAVLTRDGTLHLLQLSYWLSESQSPQVFLALGKASTDYVSELASSSPISWALRYLCGLPWPGLALLEEGHLEA